jgi:hypothetical protein
MVDRLDSPLFSRLPLPSMISPSRGTSLLLSPSSPAAWRPRTADSALITITPAQPPDGTDLACPFPAPTPCPLPWCRSWFCARSWVCGKSDRRATSARQSSWVQCDMADLRGTEDPGRCRGEVVVVVVGREAVGMGRGGIGIAAAWGLGYVGEAMRWSGGEVIW